MKGGRAQALFLVLAAVAAAALAAASCKKETTPPMMCGADLAVTSVTYPTPVISGSAFRISGMGFDHDCGTVEVRFSGAYSGSPLEFFITPSVESLNLITFTADPSFMIMFGAGGRFTGYLGVRVSVAGSILNESTYPVQFDVASSIQPVLTGVVPVDVTLNAAVSVQGSGFIHGGEGSTWAVLDGTFTREVSGSFPVTGARVAVYPVEEADRARGYFNFSPSIAGIVPGTFDGTVKLVNEHAGGAVLESGSVPAFFILGLSFITSVTPAVTSLGGILSIEGAGFIGATPEETMTFLVEGTAYPYGGEPRSVAGLELIGRYVDGGHVAYEVIPQKLADHLVALDFGFQRGSFVGQVTPVLEYRGDGVNGMPTNIEFELGPVKQVVFVQFSDNFSRTLGYFGLKAVDAYVRQAILDKMRRVYAGINVEFREEAPEDYYPGGYAIIEISGPDPNGKGLFGYDNTPGKDVWNLRLEDRIGGVNAETQEDGYSGYGGVFIDSVLCWSSNVPAEVVCPLGFEPEPLFDQIFDPVRGEQVVAGEFPSGPDPMRTAQIGEAIRVLGNIIGDTAAHELGHSLGLAHPLGPPDLVHNEPPGPGCLMDSGAYRPLDERAEVGGAIPGSWCGDEARYLQMILAVN